MKTCLSAACPYLARFGQAATYRDDIDVCSDCGGELSAGALEEAGLPVGIGAHAKDLGRSPTRALLVTIGAALASLALTFVRLPRVHYEASSGALGDSWRGLVNAPPVQLSVGALGLASWLSAYVVIELLALVVPNLRRLRDDGPAGRARLFVPTLVLGLVITGGQAVVQTEWMRSVSTLGEPLLYGGADLLAARGAIVAGSLCSVVLALLVSRYGLGNGFSVLLGIQAMLLLVESALEVSQHAADGVLSRESMLVGMALLVAAVLLVWRFVGLDPSGETGRLPRPLAGTLALSLSYSLLLFPSTLAVLLDMDGLGATLPRAAFIAVDVVVVALLTVGLAFVLYLPKRVAAAQEAAGVTAPDAKVAFRRALPATFAFSFGLLAISYAADSFGILLDVLLLAVVVTVARDVAGELRFRRENGAVLSAWPVQRLYLVERGLEALTDAGIAAYPRGLHHRLLGQVFAPWVPVELLVPADDVERAREVLRERWPPCES